MDWEKAGQMNIDQIELMLADKANDLDEDRELLAELASGVDVRVVLQHWIERSIRQAEANLRDMNEYVARFKKQVIEGITEKGGP